MSHNGPKVGSKRDRRLVPAEMSIRWELTNYWGHQVAYDLPVEKKEKSRPRVKCEFFAIFKDGSLDVSEYLSMEFRKRQDAMSRLFANVARAAEHGLCRCVAE